VETLNPGAFTGNIEELSKIAQWGSAKGADIELDEIDEKFGQARFLVEGDKFVALSLYENSAW
jgi:hypothetical protein